MLYLRQARPYRKKHTIRAVLLVSAIFLAGAMFMAFYRYPAALETTAAARENSKAPVVLDDIPIALPDSIQKGMPRGLSLVKVMPAEAELWAGKMLLIDEGHPVPGKAAPPNTLSIAAEGEGLIAVRTPRPNTDLEVIKALKKMFYMARSQKVNSWLVWEGSRSYGQQLELQLERLKQHAQTMALTEAAKLTAMEVPAPGYSEHQLPYVVDLRLADGWNAAPEDAPLNASADGKLLLDSAWQYGFIHRYGTKTAPPYEDEAYHFRYVGVAHSTIMHALHVDFPRYLAFLREEGTITYYEEGVPRYTVLCKRVDDGLSFSIPEGCLWEASMDNTGYAVMAVTFPETEE
jgi:D-alanyl-D-alanine carboxypeptidase